MRTEFVVWDWNGTLFDDTLASVEVANALLTEFDLPRLPHLDAYRAAFGFPIVDYYARLGFDTTPTGNFDAAARRYIALYPELTARCVLNPGAEGALAELARRGLSQVVVSASEDANLRRQMAPFGLDRWLVDAVGIGDIYARSKLELARGWLSDHGADARGVLFVGDTTHDADIAAELGARCVLFSGGHQARPALEACGVPVVNRLTDVLAFVDAD